jgi:histidinol dehydrogenase
MAINIPSVTCHRERENGLLVYPVYSRRSKGLSLGVNLFPDVKSCPFDCPYCEVFPFKTDTVFSIDKMKTELKNAIQGAIESNIEIKDICFSGNGEPSLSSYIDEAINAACLVRSRLAPNAKLVLITNGAGLLKERIFTLLINSANGTAALDIWLKLDAGTPQWYKKINRSEIPYYELVNVIKNFTKKTTVTIQTILCTVDGFGPSINEKQTWEQLLCELSQNGTKDKGGIRKVQLYGKVRPAPEDPKASALPVTYLEERAASLYNAFIAGKINPPVIEVYP